MGTRDHLLSEGRNHWDLSKKGGEEKAIDTVYTKGWRKVTWALEQHSMREASGWKSTNHGHWRKAGERAQGAWLEATLASEDCPQGVKSRRHPNHRASEKWGVWFFHAKASFERASPENPRCQATCCVVGWLCHRCKLPGTTSSTVEMDTILPTFSFGSPSWGLKDDVLGASCSVHKVLKWDRHCGYYNI